MLFFVFLILGGAELDSADRTGHERYQKAFLTYLKLVREGKKGPEVQAALKDLQTAKIESGEFPPQAGSSEESVSSSESTQPATLPEIESALRELSARLRDPALPPAEKTLFTRRLSALEVEAKKLRADHARAQLARASGLVKQSFTRLKTSQPWNLTAKVVDFFQWSRAVGALKKVQEEVRKWFGKEKCVDPVGQVPVPLPEGVDETSVACCLRVAGYNIAHARGEKSGGLNEIGKLSKLRSIAQLLKDQNIEVVGLTEISSGDARVVFQNQPGFLARSLGFHHVYAENYSRGPFGTFASQGNAVISKYPIVSHRNHLLYRSDDKQERRSCLETVIDLGKAGKIRFLVAHLSLRAEESTRQIQQIWDLVTASSDPVILVGDFNSRPNSSRVRWLSSRMTDGTAHLTTTFMNKPGVKIDYQFLLGPWHSGSARVVGFDADLSDHGCVINDYWLLKRM